MIHFIQSLLQFISKSDSALGLLLKYVQENAHDLYDLLFLVIEKLNILRNEQ